MNPTLLQTILVVDDDRETVRLLRAYLEQAGFRVYTAYDGETALHILRRERPHLAIVDLMLPERDGWSLTRIINSDTTLSAIPVIMLTARVEADDKILGLELGADDYVTKPFNPREIVARVRSVLRRVNQPDKAENGQILQYRALRLDPIEHQVQLEEHYIYVTPIEFAVLRTLLRKPGRVFTRAEIIEHGFGFEYAGLERTLDTHIKNLRKKVEKDPSQPVYIQTVYGVGYRLGEHDLG